MGKCPSASIVAKSSRDASVYFRLAGNPRCRAVSTKWNASVPRGEQSVKTRNSSSAIGRPSAANTGARLKGYAPPPPVPVEEKEGEKEKPKEKEKDKEKAEDK